MSNKKCICELLDNNDFDLVHLIEYYVSYISIFYGTNILDDVLNNKINDINEYIERKIGELNV